MTDEIIIEFNEPTLVVDGFPRGPEGRRGPVGPVAFKTGVLANREAAPDGPESYFSTDVNGGQLDAWNGSAWVPAAPPVNSDYSRVVASVSMASDGATFNTVAATTRLISGLSTAAFTVPAEPCILTLTGLCLDKAVAGDMVSIGATVDDWATVLPVSGTSLACSDLGVGTLVSCPNLFGQIPHPAITGYGVGDTIKVGAILTTAAARTGVYVRVVPSIARAPMLRVTKA